MKKNVLFLTLSLLISLPLTAAGSDYYDYPYVETESIKIELPYETDIDADGPFGNGIETRNPKDIFEEAKKLVEQSRIEKSKKTEYYLSKRFQDLQTKSGQYITEPSIRYCHAINALRKDLHAKHNIDRIVALIRGNRKSSSSQKREASTLQTILKPKDKKISDKIKAISREKIKALVALLYSVEVLKSSAPASAGAAAAQSREEDDEEDDEAPQGMVRRNAKRHPVAPAPQTPSSPTAEGRRVQFNPAVKQARFQATDAEFLSMHGESLTDSATTKLLERKKTLGTIVSDQNADSIQERIQVGSVIALNDLPSFPAPHAAADQTQNPDKK